MTDGESKRITVGSCEKCGRSLRLKPKGLRQDMRLTCKCGHVNSVSVDKETLKQYGVIRFSSEEYIYQRKDTPLHILLSGPSLDAIVAKEIANWEDRHKGVPDHLRPPLLYPIAISINPYASLDSARLALNLLVERVKNMKIARPFSIELFQNSGIRGLLDAPFFIFLGIIGYDEFKVIVQGLHCDFPRIGAGAEWEIWSQSQGERWRGDAYAHLLERWVFVDEDTYRTFIDLPSY